MTKQKLPYTFIKNKKIKNPFFVLYFILIRLMCSILLESLFDSTGSFQHSFTQLTLKHIAIFNFCVLVQTNCARYRLEKIVRGGNRDGKSTYENIDTVFLVRLRLPGGYPQNVHFLTSQYPSFCQWVYNRFKR